MQQRKLSNSGRYAGVLAMLVALTAPAGWAQPAVFPPDRPGPPGALRTVAVPLPANLGDFVADRQAAIVLGKALFWDERAGSDGQACASCHFQAGADNRVKNQLNPGLRNELGGAISQTFNRTASGGRGPNYIVKKADFPFHQLANPDDRNSTVLFDTDDIMSSQGVFNTEFLRLDPVNVKKDACAAVPFIFNVQGINVRNVEPRNTPTTINAIFNFRSFWDGRANNIFNGRNPFGPRDPTATVLVADVLGNLSPIRVGIPDASLASQAVGPALSEMEMSCNHRTFEMVGRKLLARPPLMLQTVDPTDSVLGPYATRLDNGAPGGKGLSIGYAALIQKAFQPRFWSSPKATADGFTQMEKNFSLFWGLAIMLYESTLVSDDTPFDRYVSGDQTAMTTQQVNGFLQVFMGKGGCIFCHKGPEFTSAAAFTQKLEQAQGAQVENMIMGDGQVALYDTGFYNIGVRPPVEDIGSGGKDPWGNPLSWTRQAKKAAVVPTSFLFSIAPDGFSVLTCTFQNSPCIPIASTMRDAVDGSFKTPTLRNVELTGPYFHNGGQATLEQVVDFYDRGGDGRGSDAVNTTGYGPNPSNRAPAILPLNLTAADRANLVAFLKALTDERVRWEKAPFDHPELHLPNGHPINELSVLRNGATIQAMDSFMLLPAVGAAGRAAKNLPPLLPFEAGLR